LQFAGGNWQVTNNFIPGGGSLIFAGAAVTASGGMFNYTATNLVVNAGNLLVGGGQRLSPVTAGATLTVSGGSLTVSNTTYGARLGNSSANNASQAGFLSFAGVQTGGTVLIVSNGDNVLSLGGFGPATSGQSASYTLSGGSLIIPSGGGSGNGLWLGADSNQLATTTFTLAGTGTVLAYNIKGAQGGGAQQVLNFSGGTLSAAAINMSLLQSSNAPTVSGTLYNNGGVLAPGGLGLPGKTTITGNYTNAANTALVVDLGGTNAASLFQDTSSNSYDNVSVTGGTLVNGALTVNLLNGFSPALTNGFTILASAGGVSGSFTNLFAGNRVAVAGNPAYSFQVLTTSTAVILTNFELNAPLVTVSPATDAVPYGSNVVLSAVATGVAPLAYQWYDENTNLISGATGATLTLTSPAVAASGNYTVVVTNIYGVATNLAAVTVSPATLTITANSAIKTYGQTVSYGAGSSAFTSTGLQNGQTVGSVTITAGGGTAATAPVGVYSLTPGAATGGTFNPANYSIAYNPNTLTVNALGVTATANPQTKVYGTADPALTYGFSPALVGGDTFSGGLSRAAGSAVGSYAITQGTLALSTNYSLTYVGTNLTITPAALTITANNASKTYGNTLTFAGTEFTASTLVTGDSVSSVTLNSAGATNTAAPGSYSIVPSAATGTGLGNYSIAYTNGTLTVSAANAGLTVGSSQTPVGYLGGVAFTATVNTNATGSVVFTDVAGAFSTNTLTAGTAASVTITNLPRGTNVITVVYSGDPDYAAATNTFEEVVTNHPPVAQTMTVTFTAGLGGEIALTDLATNWSDGDGDAVELTAINFTSTNGATVWPINLTTNLGGSYALTASAYLGYSNPANVPDRITYTISDGFGGSATGSINILIQTAVTGTNSITSLVSGIPTSLTAYGVPGFSYITQRSTNLTDWVEISTNTAATNGVINVNDGFSDLGGIAPTQAYYRLRWRP